MQRKLIVPAIGFGLIICAIFNLWLHVDRAFYFRQNRQAQPKRLNSLRHNIVKRTEVMICRSHC